MLHRARRIQRKQGFGVDFGHRFTKAVVVAESLEGLSVRAAAAIPTPPGTFEGDRIVEKRKLANMIRKTCREQDVSPTRGRFCVPSSALSLRWMSLPRIADEDLLEAAAIQARRCFGNDPSEIYAALVPLCQSASSATEVEYLLIAAPREVVDSRADVLEAAGIEPAAADIEAYATLRSLATIFSKGGVFWRNQSLTFVEMGKLRTKMYVVRDMCLRFLRAIPFGGRDVALAVAEQLGCTETEALQTLEAPSTHVDPSGKLNIEAELGCTIDMRTVLDPLVRELGRLMAYYRSLFPERSYAGILDRAYLCGGMAALRGLDACLGAYLGVSVQGLNPFSRVSARFDVAAFESVSHKEHAFCAAIGLASAELEQAPAVEGGTVRDSEFIWSRAA